MTGPMTDRFAILLRHGAYRQKPDTPSALQPYGLTEAGRHQAESAGRELADLAKAHGWQLSAEIICSRQLRAWETATLVARALGEATGTAFQVSEDETLAERSVGAMANLSLQDIVQILDDDPRYPPPPGNWKSDSHYRLPVQGAESLMEAGERVASLLDKNLSALPDGAASGATAQIFVGHGASLRHAAHHLGVLAFDDIARLSMHHARPVVLKRSPGPIWHHHAGAWKDRRPLDPALD